MTLNARYPEYLIEIASWAMYVQDPRAAAWLARRLPGEGVPTGDRLTLMPWPFPEHLGLLARSPVLRDHCLQGEVLALSLHGTDWAADLEAKAARSMAMLQAASRSDESIVAEELVTPAETGIVMDWLNTLPETDPRMLDRLPKVTWAQAVQHTLNYHRRLTKRTIRIAGDDGAVDSLPTVDGHRWLHLVTPAALDRESGAMGHCVGDGGYDYEAWPEDQAGNHIRPSDPMDAVTGIWSLRNADGRSILTAEIGIGYIEQCKRRFNDEPVPADVPHLAVLIAHLSAVLPNLGIPSWLVTDARDGSLHHVQAMPDGIHLDDGIYLDTSNWTRAPAGLRVNGGTIIAGDSEETLLFCDLHVTGRLAVHGNVDFDAGLVVEGDFDLTNAEDKRVPEGARVTGRIITEGAEDPGIEGYHLVPLTAALNAASH